MPLTAGTRLGSYEITAQIGVGGMGEVYRATDTNLGREVAIKVLPEAFAQDAERLARFEREAKTLASLNHPNIAIIHGVEVVDGMRALVMELVEGETLHDRIARGPVPTIEALSVAREMAAALEAAHEQGIIHRDLKPANIKVRPDGTVKVLDFGLAKMVEGPAAAYAADAATAPKEAGRYTMSPTITTPAMTQMGVILGTAAYMSPEQAKGREADKRSDLWSFGAVVYEMLAGRRAFDGEDMSETLATVIKSDPEWGALPTDVPLAVRTLLRTCLQKDPRKRTVDATTALFVLDQPTSLGGTDTRTQAAAPPAIRGFWRYALVALVVATLATAATWFLTRTEPPPVSRLELTIAVDRTATASTGRIALARDGSWMAYAASNPGAPSNLMMRRFDQLDVTMLAPIGTHPFVSADGRWIGFLAQGTLRKVANTGGPSIEITRTPGAIRGATWSSDDTIVFGTLSLATGLMRVSGTGGEAEVLTRPDKARGEGDHWWPQFLPGGRFVLFTIAPEAGGTAESQIALLDLQSPATTPKIVVRGGANARYLATGHLAYVAAGSLWLVPFDLDRLEVRAGSPMRLVEALGPVDTFADYDVADNGTLIYLTGADTASPVRTLTWVDRHGREEPISAQPRAYLYPRISPDGTRLALDIRDQENDIWVWDLTRPGLTRITKDRGQDRTPVWSSDGQYIIFSAVREGRPNVYRQRSDGTGIPERLTDALTAQFPISLSPKGDSVLIHEGVGGPANADLMTLRLDPPSSGQSAAASTGSGDGSRARLRDTQPLIKTVDGDANGVVSPDGQWIAYQSNQSGNWDIYVRPFADIERGVRSTVSTGGGIQPRWSANGRELFYLSPDNEMMSVRVGNGATWSASAPEKLFDAGAYFIGGTAFPYVNYDVAKDGRFLMIKPSRTADEAITGASLIVVQNWFEELRRLVPTN